VADAGTGLQAGRRAVQRARGADDPLTVGLDVFHLEKEARQALGWLWRKVEARWHQADQADVRAGGRNAASPTSSACSASRRRPRRSSAGAEPTPFRAAAFAESRAAVDDDPVRRAWAWQPTTLTRPLVLDEPRPAASGWRRRRDEGEKVSAPAKESGYEERAHPLFHPGPAWQEGTAMSFEQEIRLKVTKYLERLLAQGSLRLMSVDKAMLEVRQWVPLSGQLSDSDLRSLVLGFYLSHYVYLPVEAEMLSPTSRASEIIDAVKKAITLAIDGIPVVETLAGKIAIGVKGLTAKMGGAGPATSLNVSWTGTLSAVVSGGNFYPQ